MLLLLCAYYTIWCSWCCFVYHYVIVYILTLRSLLSAQDFKQNVSFQTKNSCSHWHILSCLGTSAWCNILPHCRQHITASNNHIQLLHNHFMPCDCCVALVQHLKGELREAQCIYFSYNFPTIHNEFQLKSHTHASTHSGDSDNVLWWYQIGGLYSRQIQLAMLAHSTKPFVLQTHMSMLQRQKQTRTSTNAHRRMKMFT